MINLNEVCSGFNYVASAIKKCEIENSITILGGKAQYQISMDIACGDIAAGEKEDTKFAKLLLDLKCEVAIPDDSQLHTSIRLQTEGTFSAKSDISDEQFQKMLLINGTSALYGIVRSKLETISASMYDVGKIRLPMINVLELLKEMNVISGPKNDP